MQEYNNTTIAVIGGGPAGMMAAGTAASLGADVTVFEHTDRLGKKLAITGKGRCNVTNFCSANEFLENVTRNHRFLYTAINAFSPADTMDLFSSLGVALKVERGNRVFPETDKAKTIVDAMKKYASGARTLYEHVRQIIPEETGGFTVLAGKPRRFDKVIIATGGRSYPLTGSDGTGYDLAKSLGHTVTPISPSLVPIECASRLPAEMMGLTLKNISINIRRNDGKVIYSDFGEMLFTHFGVSGPVILSASAHIDEKDIASSTLEIDLKPALDEKTLDARVLSDFSKNTNKCLINALGGLLPSKMIEPFIKKTELDPYLKINTLTKAQRLKIVSTLKVFTLPLKRLRPIDEAVITRGGVEVRELVPKTMESKLIPGLYFAGEVIDVDAYTGGFNLQIAYSTGYLAGKSAAES